MFSRRTIIYAMVSAILLFVFDDIANSKSLYVINNTNTSQLKAYKIEDANLTYQTYYNCVSSSGAVGIAIDESEYGQFLFVTFELSNMIEIVNAKTMQYLDAVTVAGAFNLASIVVDNGKSKVYIINRESNHLYVYSWDPVTDQLTPDFPDPYYVQLQDCSYGYGIALDEENSLLYVSDNTDEVKFYDTNDWSKKGQIPVSCNVISVAIDVNNQLLYYGSMGSYGQGDPNLYQYDISTQNENSINVGCSVAGIAVDRSTSLIYLTTYGGSGDSIEPYPKDRLFVYDANLNEQWYSDDIGNPAGVCVPSGDVGYKPPRFYLKKVDVNEPNSVVPKDYITYTITYGPNGYDHNNVIITDYLPKKVSFISASGPNMDYDSGTVTWQIGSLAANAPNDSVTLTVQVNELAEPLDTITNYCEIENEQYCSSATVYTDVRYWGGDIIYVDANATAGFDTGTSWYNAYLDLQDALDRAITSDKISKKYLTNLKKCCNMLINRKSISNPLEEYNTKIRKPFVLAMAEPTRKLN